MIQPPASEAAPTSTLTQYATCSQETWTFFCVYQMPDTGICIRIYPLHPTRVSAQAPRRGVSRSHQFLRELRGRNLLHVLGAPVNPGHVTENFN